MKEVERVLEYSPTQSEALDDHEYATWNVALWNNHKLFVSHPFYQNFLWKKISGKPDNWDNRSILNKIGVFFQALFLFLLVNPFIVVYDTIFRDNDIMFLNSEQKRAKDGGDCEGTFLTWIRDHMHNTVYRIIVHHVMEFFFLIMLFLTLVDPNDVLSSPDVHSYDIVSAIFIASYLLDDIIGIVLRRAKNFSSFWHIFKLITSLMLSCSYITYALSMVKLIEVTGKDDRSVVPGNDPVNVGATLFAVGGTLALLRPLRWFLLIKTYGPVVVCIVRVIRDTLRIFLIFILILFAFAVGTFATFKPFYASRASNTTGYHLQLPDLLTTKGIVMGMMWRVFEPGRPEFVTINKCDPSVAEDCPDDENLDIDKMSVEFSHSLGIVMWAAYQIITVILLINILIAMMNTTYLRIWERADMEWKYSKSFYQVEFLSNEAILPPPLRFLYYFSNIVHCLKSKCNPASSSQGTKKDVSKTKYEELLEDLLITKMKTDFEKSHQEDFLSVRKDLENYIDEKELKSNKLLLQKIEKLISNKNVITDSSL